MLETFEAARMSELYNAPKGSMVDHLSSTHKTLG